MSVLRIVLLSTTLLTLSACASLPAPDGLSASSRGMSKKQLLSCMGAPKTSAVEANKEYLTYFYRNFYDRYTYQCVVTVLLTDGSVSKLTVSGDSSDITDAVPEVCKTVVPKCMR